MRARVLVLDFGGQYNMLIARRVRENHVYAEIRAWNRITANEIAAAGYKGVILTGGPNSVYDPASPHFDAELLELGIPILGICYGHQLLAWMAGGEIASAGSVSEYGKVELETGASPLFSGVAEKSVCWMSHTDYVKTLPPGFAAVASTASCPCAAMADEGRRLYGVQFHPEVTHTQYGRQILRNFLFEVCGCAGDWTTEDFLSASVERLRGELEGKRALCALSGGVDSAVAAALLHRAIGERLVCVFVDHGLLRAGEADAVEKVFRGQLGVKLIRVEAGERFLTRLAGVEEPERKRRIIGEEFIRIFEEEARKLGRIDVLVQGTIYPDVIESGAGDAAVIKSHHNVGGLPEHMDFEGVVEPLRELFKDEVRALGLSLGLPEALVLRQPFPGPGLAVRVMGAVTKEKLDTLRAADAVFRQEIDKAPYAERPSQYFAVLLNERSVGVMGDMRRYGRTVALRAVTTDDFMTADWTRLPYETLAAASARITNEVPGVSRVVYDISSKPPATVEWE